MGSCSNQKVLDLQTTFQLETNARKHQMNSNQTMINDMQSISAENKQLISKLNDMEQERLKLEADARDNGNQLREMAEKVFQLLERLKLAELRKKKSAEALVKKEQELCAVKKNQNMIMTRICEKVEDEKRDLEDQLRAVKKVNLQLGHKLKEETKVRLREEEARKEANEKVQILDGRMAFLLIKLQRVNEARSVQQEELKRMETQMQSMVRRSKTLQVRLSNAETSNHDFNDTLQQAEKKNQAWTTDQRLKLHEEKDIRAERKVAQQKETFGKHPVGDHRLDTLS